MMFGMDPEKFEGTVDVLRGSYGRILQAPETLTATAGGYERPQMRQVLA